VSMTNTKKWSKRQAIANENCIFCVKGCGEEGCLYQILTFDGDSNLQIMVTELQ